MLLDVSKKNLTEATLSEHLHKAVEKYESDTLMQSSLAAAANDAYGVGGSLKRRKLFLSPDNRLWEYLLPAPVTHSDETEQAAVLTRTSSSSSTASAAAGEMTQSQSLFQSQSQSQVVDLTELD